MPDETKPAEPAPVYSKQRDQLELAVATARRLKTGTDSGLLSAKALHLEQTAMRMLAELDAEASATTTPKVNP